MKTKILILIFLFAISTLAYAQGPLNEALAERQTVFNNITDFFATRGKTSREKKQIKRERRELRKRIRLNKLRDKEAKKSKKKIKKQQKDLMKKIDQKKRAKQNYLNKRNQGLKGSQK